jgi:hypothetical protein
MKHSFFVEDDSSAVLYYVAEREIFEMHCTEHLLVI